MQDKKNVKPPQSSYILRILGGGYLVYLAYDLVTGDGLKSPLIYAAAAGFVLIGGILLAHSLYVLAHHEYFYDRSDTESGDEYPDETLSEDTSED